MKPKKLTVQIKNIDESINKDEFFHKMKIRKPNED